MKKLAVVVVSVALAAFLGLELAAPYAWAVPQKDVDCAKVMDELNAGKKVKEVMKDLGYSRSNVNTCRRNAAKAAKAAKAEAPAAAASPAAGAPAPAPAGSPAAPK